MVRPTEPGISECALKYAHAIADPWSPEALGACVPCPPVRNSQKVRAFSRYTAIVGSSGVGFAFLTPTISKTNASVITSTGAFTGALFSTVTIAAGGYIPAVIGSIPYTATQVTNSAGTAPSDATCRIVAAGLAWQYTGTVSNMSGVCYSLCHPDHGNLNGEDFSTYSETTVQRVDSGRHWVTIHGMNSDETRFGIGTGNGIGHFYPMSSSELFFPSGDADLGGSPVGVWFTGTPNSTFLIEAVVHLEYAGQLVQSIATPSHADAVGFDVVQQAAAMLPLLKADNLKASGWSLMRTALSQALRTLKPVAVSALKGAAIAYLGTSGPIGQALIPAVGALRL